MPTTLDETEPIVSANSTAKKHRTVLASPSHTISNGASSGTTTSLLAQTSKYGAAEIKDYIPKATTRGFAIAMTSAFLLLGSYAAFVANTNSLKTRGPVVNKMKLTNLPPPPQTVESVPPPPTTAPGPASRAGTPVPVPDALIAPDVKDFANVDEISRASTIGGDGQDQGYMGLASDVDVEVREQEPNAYECMALCPLP